MTLALVVFLAAVSGAASDAAAPDVEDVIVTARKRAERVLDVPETVTVLSARSLAQRDIRTVSDVAAEIPNLGLAYGNAATAIGDARTISIRGVSGPNTTALYLDQTPIPASLDPQLVDLDRVEVLKGPQGTIYGESSMGGAVKLITRAPDPGRRSFTVSGEAGGTQNGGRPDLGLEGIANLPLGSQAAFRFGGFLRQEAGYLARAFPDPADPARQEIRGDQGAKTSYGGSAALLFTPGEGLQVTLRALYQGLDYHGFPASFAPLPSFEPVRTLARPFDIQPRVTDRWVLPALEVTYQGRGWQLVSSTSGFGRRIGEVEDSTTGTAQFLDSIGAPLPAQPFVWQSDRRRSQVSHETRLLFGEAGAGISGVAGLYASKAWDDFRIFAVHGNGLAASGAWPDDLLWSSDITGSQQDLAAFGQVDVPLAPPVTLTLGLRQYWLSQTYRLAADGFLNGGLTDGPPGRNSAEGLSPKVALAIRPGEDDLIFASAGKGFRAGGSGQAVIPQCDASLQMLGLTRDAARHYEPDSLWSYEVGAKTAIPDHALQASATAFHIDWQNIQQSVFLPSCAFIITTNAGAAVIDGGELEISGSPVAGLELRFSAGYQDARITRPGATAQPVGSRVYQTPRWTLSGSGYYERPLAGPFSAFAGLDASYVGDSLSNNGGGTLVLTRPAYALVNARLGVRWPDMEVALSLRNLGDARPNLGDIGYLGYGQRDPVSPDLPMPQVVTLPPTSVSLQIRYAL